MSISSIASSPPAYAPPPVQQQTDSVKPATNAYETPGPSRQPALAPVAPGVGRIVDLSA